MGSRSRKAMRSLGLHAVALLVVLIAMVPVIGLRGQVLNDEGAALAQVHLLNDQNSWFMQNPFPEADPDGLAFPYLRPTHTEDGFAPLLRHPLYSVLLAGADRVGGRFGIELVGIIGTLLAAVAAALLSREIRPGLELATLWITGAFSPLFFDAFMIVAHSLGAAGAGFAALGLVRYLRRRHVRDLVMALVGIILVALLRREGMLLGAALGAAVIMLTFRKKPDTRAAARAGFIGGSLMVGVSVLAYLADHLAFKLLAPTLLPTAARPLPSAGYLPDRVDAFVLTWLVPGSGDGPTAGPIILLVFAMVLAFQLRRAKPDRTILAIAIIGVWAGAVYWVTANPRSVVPGILMAFPLLAVAIVGWRRPRRDDVVVRILALASVLFAAAVLATTYAVGGTVEWGSRYLAVGIPLVTPLIVLTLQRLGRRLPSPRRTWATLALVPLTIVPAVVSITALRTAHTSSTTELEAPIAARISAMGTVDGQKLVVVTDVPHLPRVVWRQVDRARWLNPTDEDLPDLLDRLDANAVNEFLFITRHTDPQLSWKYSLSDCEDLIETWRVCEARRVLEETF